MVCADGHSPSPVAAGEGQQPHSFFLHLSPWEWVLLHQEFPINAPHPRVPAAATSTATTLCPVSPPQPPSQGPVFPARSCWSFLLGSGASPALSPSCFSHWMIRTDQPPTATKGKGTEISFSFVGVSTQKKNK